ncbi:MAG: thioredoxin-dependent thiol peroxidase [Bacteroidales bacterium]|nr:thioredoxin-dependent thiol peroxidase [Bacteroidales bacterium]MDT8373239.1 thioredoxin-dependent thiol peroxidase [Bacteroidales bacterium]
MTQPTPGTPAPQFEGTDQNGNIVKLSSYLGKKVVLYFYPKDNTPGCTAEACSLRDNYEELLNQGFAVLGISPDSVASHGKFAAKYELPFPLIADPEKKILTAYGAYGEKSMYGKKVTGVIRTTFIIDEKGIIEKVIKKVDTKAHAPQIFKLYGNV